MIIRIRRRRPRFRVQTGTKESHPRKGRGDKGMITEEVGRVGGPLNQENKTTKEILSGHTAAAPTIL